MPLHITSHQIVPLRLLLQRLLARALFLQTVVALDITLQTPENGNISKSVLPSADLFLQSGTDKPSCESISSDVFFL